MAQEKVHFFCVALGEKYEQYVDLHLATALFHNPGATAEVLVLNRDRFVLSVGITIQSLMDGFPGKITIRESSIWNEGREKCMAPYFRNAIRFLEQPKHTPDDATLVYIGDVDIIYTEPVSPHHVQEMCKTGLPFSNWIRPSNVLTGLHCVRPKEYYNGGMLASMKKQLDELDNRIAHGRNFDGISDEKQLTDMCAENWDLEIIRTHTKARPVFGVHYSVSCFGFEEKAHISPVYAGLVHRAPAWQKDILREFQKSPEAKAVLVSGSSASKMLDDILNLREKMHPLDTLPKL